VSSSKRKNQMGITALPLLFTLTAAAPSFDFESGPPGARLVILGALLLAAIAGLYLLDLRGARFRARWVLPALRAFAILLLLILFLQPVLFRTSERSPEPVVAVLIDRSESMTLEANDEERSTTRLEEARSLLEGSPANLLSGLDREFDVRLFSFAEKITELGDSDAPNLTDSAASGKATNLGGAMHEVADRLEPDGLAALVVLSDGAWNAGLEPGHVAGLLGARGIPVYPVGLGSPKELLDLSVESVLADETVLAGDRVRAEIVARAEGFDGTRLDLRIRRGSDHIAGASPAVEAGSGIARQEFAFDLPPDTPPNQPLTYEVWIPPLEDETTKDNNTATFRVRLVDRPLRVLLVEETPRWEFRYLKNALLRDPGIEVEAVLLDYAGRPARGDIYRHWYPDRAEALAEIDVIVLGDVSPAWFSPEQIEATRGFVDSEGGGVIFQAGIRNMPWKWVDTPLGDLLPVIPAPSRFGVVSPEGYTPGLTAEGRNHPAFSFAFAGREGPAALPGFRWAAAVEDTKPAAVVLADHPSAPSRLGRLPLAVSMRYGRGRTMYLGFDSTWRWRFGIGDEVHYRFWGRLLRWMAENRFQGGTPLVRLDLDRRTARPGEQVGIRARVLDRGRYPLENAEVRVEYETGEGERGEIPLAPDPSGRGHYSGEFSPRNPGEYVFRPRIPALTGEEFGIEASLTVHGRDRELSEPAPNHDLLERVAARSGGRFHTPDDAGRIPREIRPEQPRIQSAGRITLWDSPYVIIIVTTLLGAEWWLRKKKGFA
jgi:hypothetical protein